MSLNLTFIVRHSTYLSNIINPCNSDAIYPIYNYSFSDTYLS